jgi:hypothetical protein
MKKLFRFYIDAGADAVINHHTHCVSGYEEYKDKPIYYSLGNFLFDKDSYRNSIWNEGLAVVLTFGDSEINHNRLSFSQCNEEPVIKLHKDLEIEMFESKIKQINTIIDSDEHLLFEFHKFCESNRKLYESYLEPYSNRYLHYLRNRNLFPRLHSRKKKKYLLNLIRCESHRDIIIQYLKEGHKFVKMKIAIQNKKPGFILTGLSIVRKMGLSKLVDCYNTDIMNQIDDCDALMWHHNQAGVKDIVFAKQLLFAVEHAGKVVFPDFRTGWHFDDKVAQKYLLEATGIDIVPTYVFMIRVKRWNGLVKHNSQSI